jgi:hypothetical protein
MATGALKVNQQTKKTYSLKKLAKQRKRIGTGDGGLLTDKTRGLFK